MEVSSIRGKPWITFDHNTPEPGRMSILDDGFSFQLDSTVSLLKNENESLARELIKVVAHSTNWADLATNDLQPAIDEGYQYNDWTKH